MTEFDALISVDELNTYLHASPAPTLGTLGHAVRGRLSPICRAASTTVRAYAPEAPDEILKQAALMMGAELAARRPAIETTYSEDGLNRESAMMPQPRAPRLSIARVSGVRDLLAPWAETYAL